MFNYLKSLFFKGWHIISSYFAKADTFSNQQKLLFVRNVLNGQGQDKGFAIRHVDEDSVKESNLTIGFKGDAISYSITSLIMSEALNKNAGVFSWSTNNEGDVYFLTESNSLHMLDETLACKIFDLMHEKVLKFISLNFQSKCNHFMLIKNMAGAPSPYDVKDIYPTGKCGKRTIDPKQIVCVFSKSKNLSSPEAILREIESKIVLLFKPATNCDDALSTGAILNVLREIKLKGDEKKLTIEKVRYRLIESECDTQWDDFKYHAFFDRGGYFETFKRNLSQINSNLEFYRMKL
ncbi:hypothetical protein [Legionella bozemanae]|uniref:hypothetical protein n=1 Tax=Legionella bozemanae TaxID=447 RepID=UPI0010412DA6|nr:hypothetical protein [Legionella bozemanae]